MAKPLTKAALREDSPAGARARAEHSRRENNKQVAAIEQELEAAEGLARQTENEVARRRAHLQLPGLRLRLENARIAAIEAMRVWQATEGPWRADREAHHTPLVAAKLQAFDRAMAQANEALDAYCIAWAAAREDGARFEHFGWARITGQRDMSEVLGNWRRDLKRGGWL